MAFKIKDLMINDLSQAQHRGAVPHCMAYTGCACGTMICLCTGHPWTYGLTPSPIIDCTPKHTNTPFNWCTPTPIDTCTPVHTNVTNEEASGGADTLATLATLKEHLKQQLTEVEKREAALEADLAPKTVEEVDALTKKLQDALDALKAHRAALSKKP